MDVTSCMELLAVVAHGLKDALPISVLGRHWLIGNSAYFVLYAESVL